MLRGGTMRAHRFSVFLITVTLSVGWGPAGATPQSPEAPSAVPGTAAWREIGWETSLRAAKARAARTGKPLLVLHLFGRLDEEFC
jgi:hypothetical protein